MSASRRDMGVDIERGGEGRKLDGHQDFGQVALRENSNMAIVGLLSMSRVDGSAQARACVLDVQ